MAIKKKDKPLRPDPTKANYKGTTGKNPVVKITKVTKPLKKAVVRNPSAPTAAGPRGGGVRVITKSETFMKKDKARRDRTGVGRPQNASAFKKSSAQDKMPPARRTETQRLIDGTQSFRGRQPRGPVNEKGNKPTKVTPKKKAEAPKKKAPKRRLYIGRGGGMRGGIGGGGDMIGQIK
jgi:hypothetical protein